MKEVLDDIKLYLLGHLEQFLEAFAFGVTLALAAAPLLFVLTIILKLFV